MEHIHPIQSIIEKCLTMMGIEYSSVEVGESILSEYTGFYIHSPETAILIGKDGEHLLALSFVVRKMVEKELGVGNTPKFYLDAGGYQKQKIEKIQKVASIMADRAISFKRDIELPPMSSYERMVIHSTLKEKPGVLTESQGQGKERRIFVRFVETINL